MIRVTIINFEKKNMKNVKLVEKTPDKNHKPSDNTIHFSSLFVRPGTTIKLGIKAIFVRLNLFHDEYVIVSRQN